MGIFDSLKTQSPTEAAHDKAPHTSLQLLFEAPFELHEEEFTRLLRSYDKSLSAAQLSVINAGEGSSLGNVTWGTHAVQVVVFGFPMPQEPLEACIQPAPYDQESKARARAHRAHALLFYQGQSQNVSEQYVALAIVAGALCGEGGLAVLNEAAHTSLPSRVFTGEQGDRQELFRSLPPLILFAGFVKYFLEGQTGVWMRTHGLKAWGLLDLATKVDSPERSGEIFDIFNDVTAYMIVKGPVLCAGHTMQVGEDIFMKLREPTIAEGAMGGINDVLIVDFIRADQSNPFVFNM